MNKFVKPVIKLVPTFQYFNIFWNLNTEVDICVQFKYLSTRPCNCTYYIYHSTDYVLPLRKYYNLFVYLIVSWSGKYYHLPYGTSFRFVSLMLSLSNTLSLLLYSVKWYTIYLADSPLPPPPLFWLSQCVYLLFCYIGHWLQIHFTQIQQTNYLHAFFFSSVITF